jgi:hypothetical protein
MHVLQAHPTPRQQSVPAASVFTGWLPVPVLCKVWAPVRVRIHTDISVPVVSAGYACPSGTGVLSAITHGCGSPEEHCPAGSAVRTPTLPGFYALPTPDGLYFNAVMCEAGRLCTGGIARLCPAGRYGSAPGMTAAECAGNCSAGYYCPAGSVSPTQTNCSDGPGSFCPQVSSFSLGAPSAVTLSYA